MSRDTGMENSTSSNWFVHDEQMKYTNIKINDFMKTIYKFTLTEIKSEKREWHASSWRQFDKNRLLLVLYIYLYVQ